MLNKTDDFIVLIHILPLKLDLPMSTQCIYIVEPFHGHLIQYNHRVHVGRKLCEMIWFDIPSVLWYWVHKQSIKRILKSISLQLILLRIQLVAQIKVAYKTASCHNVLKSIISGHTWSESQYSLNIPNGSSPVLPTSLSLDTYSWCTSLAYTMLQHSHQVQWLLLECLSQ